MEHAENGTCRSNHVGKWRDLLSADRSGPTETWRSLSDSGEPAKSDRSPPDSLENQRPRLSFPATLFKMIICFVFVVTVLGATLRGAQG